MLRTLTVWNFALLEHVQVSFNQGLNILTGETGAGKSILIDSLGIILGKRTSTDHIRNGCEWLRVEAVFDLEKRLDIRAFLQAANILEEDGNLILTRQISRNGRNTIQANGCHIPLQTLKQLGLLLIDIHGQNENQAILTSENQLLLLENYAPEIKKQRLAYETVYKKWQQLQASLAEKKAASREYAQRLDMLRWQSSEIAAAKLESGEDEKLEAEIKLLAGAEKITGYVKASYQLLEDGNKNHLGILSALAEVKRNAEGLQRYDPSFANVLQMLTEAECQLQECAYEIRDYGEKLEYDPVRLDKMQLRMDEIYKLRKKYGATIDDVLHHYENIQKELEEIENYDEILAALQQEIAETTSQLELLADRLTQLRQAAAQELSAAISENLFSLGMPKAEFYFSVEKTDSFQLHGQDMIDMLFSANVGESVKSVRKVASGGELSRIALAVKAVTAAQDAIDVMVFDEIDTGIGGKTAQMVAEKISLVAASKQVLCITHLPQIACMADVHLYIDKQTRGAKTVTEIKKLSTSEQINEIARMASGIDITAASLDNALEMLDNAKQKKEKQRSLLKEKKNLHAAV